MAKKKTQARLFFAVELSPKIQTQLLACQQQLSSLDAVVVKAENLHLTLCFLGNTANDQLQNIIDNFQAVALPSFEISLDQLTYWPKPSILAAEASSNPDNSLTKLKQLIEKQLTDMQIFNFDKQAFKPHITLFRQLQQPPETCLNFYLQAEKIQQKKQTMKVESISLMQTISRAGGYYYQTLAEWPLKNSTSIKQQLLGR
jgi:RNA 2',3'-cyclic 3'-phosphodiesterase